MLGGLDVSSISLHSSTSTAVPPRKRRTPGMISYRTGIDRRIYDFMPNLRFRRGATFPPHFLPSPVSSLPSVFVCLVSAVCSCPLLSPVSARNESCCCCCSGEDSPPGHISWANVCFCGSSSASAVWSGPAGSFRVSLFTLRRYVRSDRGTHVHMYAYLSYVHDVLLHWIWTSWSYQLTRSRPLSRSRGGKPGVGRS